MDAGDPVDDASDTHRVVWSGPQFSAQQGTFRYRAVDFDETLRLCPGLRLGRSAKQPHGRPVDHSSRQARARASVNETATTAQPTVILRGDSISTVS
jgi:hypothetical protein